MQRTTCVACGVPAWTNLCTWTRNGDGELFACGLCGLLVHDGQVLDNGSTLEPSDVERAVARLWPGARRRLFVAPEDRVFRLVGAGRAGVSGRGAR